MGLAPYGRPIYQDAIYEHLIDLKADGSFWIDQAYFNYCQGLTMTGPKFHDLFGGPPREAESDLTQRHMDLAASIQAVTEEAVLRMARELHTRTHQRHLVLAGGVALNCVAKGRLLREGPFDDLWVQPAAGDAGGALGAARFTWHQLLEQPRQVAAMDTQRGSLLGPAWPAEDVAARCTTRGVPFERHTSESDLLDRVSGLLSAGKIVGWFHGRMEFGPRALGARSILGDPRRPEMQATMNVKIKFRESFRPFAPLVMREHASEWFGIDPAHESPYMLLVAPVNDRHRVAVSDETRELMAHDPDLRRRVNIVRSTIPAVTHVDYSARLQSVDAERHPRLHRLMQRFFEANGCPVLVDASFSVRGEPIVCSPDDAYRCFMATEMDALVVEDCVLVKEHMTDLPDLDTRQRHLAQFQLD